MPADRRPFDLGPVRSSSLRRRKSRVKRQELGRTVPAGVSFQEWFDALPAILAGRDIKDLEICFLFRL